MTNEIEKVSANISPFERIRHTNETGNEYWSSRDFAQVLSDVNYFSLSATVINPLFRAKKYQRVGSFIKP